MKKILILCYDFPPLTTAGSARPFAWYKYAKENGYDPIVVSRSWKVPINNIEDRYKTSTSTNQFDKTTTEFGIHYIVNHKNSLKEKFVLKFGIHKYSLIRKILSFIELIGRFYFSFLDDRYEMYQAADKIVTLEKPDVIIASGEPHILFTYCEKLHRKYKIPYVMDYRDGWFTNHVEDKLNPIKQLITNIEFEREKSALKNAILFTSVVPQIVEAIQQKVFPQKGIVIPNGVDISLYENTNLVPPQDKFILANTGTLYSLDYDLIFEEGVRNFLKKHKPTDFEIHFYGLDLNPNKVVAKIRSMSHEFPQHIFLNSRRNQEEIVQIQKEATVLLIMIPGSHEKGIISLKTYEYLAAKRPIIIIPNEPSKITPIFPEKQYLTFALDGKEFGEVLEDFYLKYKEGKELELPITTEELNSISRQKSTALLFSSITEALSKNN